MKYVNNGNGVRVWRGADEKNSRQSQKHHMPDEGYTLSTEVWGAREAVSYKTQLSVIAYGFILMQL